MTFEYVENQRLRNFLESKEKLISSSEECPTQGLVYYYQGLMAGYLRCHYNELNTIDTKTNNRVFDDIMKLQEKALKKLRNI